MLHLYLSEIRGNKVINRGPSTPMDCFCGRGVSDESERLSMVQAVGAIPEG